MQKEKKKRGCLIPVLIVLMIFLGAGVFGIMQNPEAYQAKSTLAKELELSSDQESAMLEILQSCGIGEITSASLFQSGEDRTSYHLFDEETAHYKGAENAIVVWVDNTSKEIQEIYFRDHDIYLNGEVVSSVTAYYVNSEDRDNYRVSAQLAVKECLNYPDTAKFPAISGWKFGIEDGIVIVQSSVTAQNALGAEGKNDFQVKFQNGTIVSLILDGAEYVQN